MDIFGVASVVLFILKVIGFTFSWWWVLSPIILKGILLLIMHIYLEYWYWR